MEICQIEISDERQIKKYFAAAVFKIFFD